MKEKEKKVTGYCEPLKLSHDVLDNYLLLAAESQKQVARHEPLIADAMKKVVETKLEINKLRAAKQLPPEFPVDPSTSLPVELPAKPKADLPAARLPTDKPTGLSVKSERIPSNVPAGNPTGIPAEDSKPIFLGFEESQNFCSHYRDYLALDLKTHKKPTADFFGFYEIVSAMPGLVRAF